MINGTLTIGDPYCSTGCPYCGCSNSNCSYNRGERRLFVVSSDPEPSELRREIDALREAGKRANRPWVAMKRAPRRYGRPK